MSSSFWVEIPEQVEIPEEWIATSNVEPLPPSADSYLRQVEGTGAIFQLQLFYLLSNKFEARARSWKREARGQGGHA